MFLPGTPRTGTRAATNRRISRRLSESTKLGHEARLVHKNYGRYETKPPGTVAWEERSAFLGGCTAARYAAVTSGIPCSYPGQEVL